MSKKEKNSIKDITEDDEETNLFRAEMMNFYKNKTEEELLNEKYRLEIKMYENENINGRIRGNTLYEDRWTS